MSTPTPTNIQSELERHRTDNSRKLEQLVDEQSKANFSPVFLLRFTAADHGDAVGLTRLLFAKGMRLQTADPERKLDGSFEVRAVLRNDLKVVTSEPFVCDLITLASGVHATYDGWELITEGAGEQEQIPFATDGKT